MASNLFKGQNEDGNESKTTQSVMILDLPEELLEKILSSCSYNDLAEIRAVCQSFNKCSERLLNSGFSRVDKLHSQIQKRVKSQLPRRESERRNHSLARHVDILSAIETRLSLLGMTYMRYMDMGLCCFIPGKVLDELFRILSTLQCPEQPPRAHEFLQELRDISSMAMEHFEEKIAPALKNKMPAVTLPFPFTDCSSREQSPGPAIPMLTLPGHGQGLRHPVRHELARIQNNFRNLQANVQQQRKETNENKGMFFEQRKKIIEIERKFVLQNKKIIEHEQKIQAQQNLIREQAQTISDLSKKILEYDQKFADVYSELTRMKGDNDSCLSTQSSSAPIVDCPSANLDVLSGLGSRCTRDSLKRKSLKEGNKGTKKQRKN